jgi:hypothetical protein
VSQEKTLKIGYLKAPEMTNLPCEFQNQHASLLLFSERLAMPSQKVLAKRGNFGLGSDSTDPGLDGRQCLSNSRFE